MKFKHKDPLQCLIGLSRQFIDQCRLIFHQRQQLSIVIDFDGVQNDTSIVDSLTLSFFDDRRTTSIECFEFRCTQLTCFSSEISIGRAQNTESELNTSCKASRSASDLSYLHQFAENVTGKGQTLTSNKIQDRLDERNIRKELQRRDVLECCRQVHVRPEVNHWEMHRR